MKAILELMKSEGLTQQDIANIIGKSQPTVNSILKGGHTLQIEDAKTLVKKFPKYLSLEKIYGDVHA